jgi:primosomal protein N'
MYVITVVPLKRGITIDTLSYFGSEAYAPGTIVSIPVRNQQVLGLVTEATEVSAAKTALRAATFSLRKLPPQRGTSMLGTAYVQTAESLGKAYAAPLGTILYNLLPPEIRIGEIPIPHTHHVEHKVTESIEVLQAREDERHLVYRSLVRETFAHAGSILFVTPTSFEVLRIGWCYSRPHSRKLNLKNHFLRSKILVRRNSSLQRLRMQ